MRERVAMWCLSQHGQDTKNLEAAQGGL
jgi:hypothetical protein